MANVTGTAWGEVTLSYADMTAEETFPSSTLTSMGDILEGSLSIEKEEGTKLELYKEGHILMDELALAPTLRIKGTLIGIPDTIKKAFWDTFGAGDSSKPGYEAEKIQVTSWITTKHFAVMLATKVSGSVTLEAPKATISLSPLYSSTQGWTADIEITILQAKTGVIVQFGEVA